MSDTGIPEINQLLARAGISAPTIAAVVRVDAVLQSWRRRAMKRELGHRALADLKIGIDLGQLDVLFAIEAPPDEFGALAHGETMIATVAERLAIDPSRASRVVSELVQAGFARRAVSQADARRTIIELTSMGSTVVQAVRAYKFLILGDFVGGWAPGDLSAFLPMLEKLGRWSDHTDAGSEKYRDNIAALAKTIASSKAPSTTASISS